MAEARNKINIFFDHRFLGNFRGGISRDAYSMYKELNNSEEFSVVQLSISLAAPKVLKKRNRTKVTAFDAWRLKLRSKTPSLLLFSNPSLPNLSTFFFGRRIIRIHDVFPITNPEWFTLRSRIAFNLGILLLRRTDLVICNSETTRATFLKVIEKKKFDHVRVWPCRPDNLPAVECQSCEACLCDLPESYLLAVGTIEPRKNYDQLISVAKKLEAKRPEIKIVIVGRVGWKVSQTLKKIVGQANVMHLSQSCDGSLSKIYGSCKALISLSLDEGYNLPLREIEAYSKPRIISNIEIHRELFNENSIFINSSDPSLICEQILNVIDGRETYTYVSSAVSGPTLNEIVLSYCETKL
jgi:glycosyltransferase involved in cell wall biosynthesis